MGLRVGSDDTKETAQRLADRLVTLRKAVEMQRPGTKTGPEPASPVEIAQDQNGSSNENDEVKAASDECLSALAVKSDEESPAKHPMVVFARESEDPLVRKAAEETDILHKKVLALEDEKASLIRDQEKLIQYIKEKVEPVQRAL